MPRSPLLRSSMLCFLLLRIRTRPLPLLLGGMAALALVGPAMAQGPLVQGEGTEAPAAEEAKPPDGALSPAPASTPAPSVTMEPKSDRWTPFWRGLAGLGFVFGAGSLGGLLWSRRELRKEIDRVRNQLKLAEKQLGEKAAGSDLGSLRSRFSEFATAMPEAIDTHLQRADHKPDSWVYRLNSWAQETNRRAAESSAWMAQLRAEVLGVRERLDAQQQVLQRLPEGLRLDLSPALPRGDGIDSQGAGDANGAAGGSGESDSAAEAQRRALRSLLERYQAAVLQSNRSGIRAMAAAELNITQASEDALTRGTGSHRTQLQAVSGGGSYLLVSQAGRNWLFPTIQTLTVLATSRAQKGIFDYEGQPVSAVELKQPAEVQPVGEAWEVISPGIVIVPG